MDDALRNYFAAAPKPDLDLYLQLDDNSIWRVIDFAARIDLGRVSTIAQRIRNRDFFKCFTPPIDPYGDPPKSKIRKFIEKLDGSGIKYYIDRTKPKRLKQFETDGPNSFKNILIVDERDDEPKPLQAFSPAVKELTPAAQIRFYFESAEERNSAKELWNL